MIREVNILVFNTYVTADGAADIVHLIEALTEGVRAHTSLEADRKEELIAALNRSGGSHSGSRYGLGSEVVFADTELISACGYERDPVAYLNYRYEFKHLPTHHLLGDFPLVVAVEASSRCNLRCRMCFQGSMDKCRPKQNDRLMDWSVYERFLSELEDHRLYSIVYASRGEPLLHPRIDDMIRAAKERGVMDSKLNTNATLLSEEMSRRLLASGLDLLVFSVDSVTEEIYRAIRGISVAPVLENIDRFLKIRKEEFPQSKMKVRVAMVVGRDGLNGTEAELARARQYWNGRVDELSIKTENDFINIYGDGVGGEHRRVCNLLWERVYLWADGTVNPCDIDHLSTLRLGNIAEGDTVAGIWHGEALTRLRREHLEQRDRMCSVCGSCVGY